MTRLRAFADLAWLWLVPAAMAYLAIGCHREGDHAVAIVAWLAFLLTAAVSSVATKWRPKR